MKGFSLSERAERSLDDIARFSLATFGPARGDAYVAKIEERCSMLATGLINGASCSAWFGDDLPDDLRFVRAGKHFVIYMELHFEFLIVDFIHQSADVGGRLGGQET